MKVRIVGTHNYASRYTRLPCYVIDDRLALDAGSLATGLTFEEQAHVEAVLLTHRHLDHTNDLLMIGGAAYYMGKSLHVYGTEPTIRALEELYFRSELFPDPRNRPSADNPAMKLHVIPEGEPVDVAGYTVLALPGNHSVSSWAYLVTDGEGKSVFYSGDTDERIAEAWPRIRPDLMLLECTVRNARGQGPASPHHLSARTFKAVIEDFRQQHGYIPKLVAVHHLPFEADTVRIELAQVAEELGVEISFGLEDDVYEV